MSFVDLATLAVHRQQEMEARIQVFLEKCDLAIQDIKKLKVKAQGFVNRLNCEPSELKERFLNYMQHLDQYIYLITDFNLAVEKLEGTSSVGPPPALNTGTVLLPIPALNKPRPSTSSACLRPIEKREKKKKRKQKNEENLLISFSSASSVSNDSITHKKEDEEVVKVNDDLKNIKWNGSMTNAKATCNLPAQTLMQTEELYQASIVHVDGLTLWVITETYDDIYNMIKDMTDYYEQNKVKLDLQQIQSMVYCSVYDEKTNAFYRGLFIKILEENPNTAEVYLVDTGETRLIPISALQPLVEQFCDKPPMARCCHLAGVELVGGDDKDQLQKLDDFMEEFVGRFCSILVDDNTSESLEVYVMYESKCLNDLVVENGFAITLIDDDTNKSPTTPVQEKSEADFDMSLCPEYDDPVIAVTGYHNRDEADICPHFKGGAQKTCFKGTRCKKRHVLKHPDGWTLDRVEVTAKYRKLPLPAPGTWLRVLVTAVAHYDHFYVQYLTDNKPEPGMSLIPKTLDELERDMNTPATKMAYKRLMTAPAIGELVAAVYSMDHRWYRARVISSTCVDERIEVTYIDYGTTAWVVADAVRSLPARCASLEAQAARCALAGVALRSAAPATPATLADARRALENLLVNRTFDMHVLARSYDEITVELYDEKGYSIAETLAKEKVVQLKAYEIEDDAGVQKKLVVP